MALSDIHAAAGPEDFGQAAAFSSAAVAAQSLGLRPLDEAAFEAAYDLVPEFCRIGLKTAVARHFATGGREAAESAVARVHVRHPQGFSEFRAAAPVDWALLVCDETTAPAQACWAATRAALAGVGEVCAAWTGKRSSLEEPGPEVSALGVLLALELAGLDALYPAGAAEVAALVKTLSASGLPGRVFFLGQRGQTAPVRADCSELPGVRVWSLSETPRRARVAVMREAVEAEADGLDLELAAWAHAGAELASFASGQPPAGFGKPGEGLADCLAWRPDCLLVDAPVLDQLLAEEAMGAEPAGLANVPMLFGPGLEACWTWPDVDTAFFRRGAVRWREEGGA